MDGAGPSIDTGEPPLLELPPAMRSAKSVSMPGVLSMAREGEPSADPAPSSSMGAAMDAFLSNMKTRSINMRGELRNAAAFRGTNSASPSGNLASGATLLTVGVRRTTMLKKLKSMKLGLEEEEKDEEEAPAELSDMVRPAGPCQT